jgi:hypothetical protein
MKGTKCCASARGLVKTYKEVHRILTKENERSIREREDLGRLEVVCDMARAMMIRERGIQLKDPIVYSLKGEKNTHIKWGGYHIPPSNQPVRAKRYSLVVIVPENYSNNASEAEYSLTMGHKISGGAISIPGRKKK